MTQLPAPRPNPHRPDEDMHIRCLFSTFDGSVGFVEDFKPTEIAGLLVIDPHAIPEYRSVQITDLGRRYWAERAPADMKARVALIDRFGRHGLRHDDDTVGLLALAERLPSHDLAKLRIVIAGADALGFDWRKAIQDHHPDACSAGA